MLKDYNLYLKVIRKIMKFSILIDANYHFYNGIIHSSYPGLCQTIKNRLPVQINQ